MGFSTDLVSPAEAMAVCRSTKGVSVNQQRAACQALGYLIHRCGKSEPDFVHDVPLDRLHPMWIAWGEELERLAAASISPHSAQRPPLHSGSAAAQRTPWRTPMPDANYWTNAQVWPNTHCSPRHPTMLTTNNAQLVIQRVKTRRLLS